MNADLQMLAEAATNAFDQEHYEEALKKYQEITQLDPKTAWAWERLGAVCLAMNDYKGALRFCTIALALDPKSGSAWFNRGRACTELRQYHRAIAAYKQTLKLGYDKSYSYNNTGVVYERLGQYDKALSNHDLAIQADGTNTLAVLNKGLILAHFQRTQKGYEEALRCFDQVLSSDPDNLKALSNKGDVLCHLKQFSRARAVYERILGLSPKYTAPWNDPGVPLTDNRLKELEKEDSKRSDQAQIKQFRAAGWRYGGVIGGILLLLLVISTFHEGVDVTQVFPALAGDLTFAALLVVCTLIFGLYGAYVGRRFAASLEARFGFLSKTTWTILATLGSGVIGFVWSAIAVLLLNRPAIDWWQYWNFLVAAIITAIAIIVGAVLGIGLVIWAINKVYQKAEAVKEAIEQYQDAFNAEIFGEAIGIQIMSPLQSWVLMTEIEDWLTRIDREDLKALVNKIVTNDFGEEKRKAILISGAVGAGIGLFLGIILSLLLLLSAALVIPYQEVILGIAVFSAVIGLVLGLAFEKRLRPRDEVAAAFNRIPSGTSLAVAGSVLGIMGSVVILAATHLSLPTLEAVYSQSYGGLIGGAIPGIILGAMVGHLIGFFSPKQADINRSAVAVGAGKVFSGVSAVGKVALGGAVAVAVILFCGFPLFGAILYHPASAAADQTVTVDAGKGWQDTGFVVQPGDELTITYVSGQWSVTGSNSPLSDANGKPANPPADLYCHCGEPLPGVSTQALIGKVGNGGKAFLVGDSYTFTAATSGDIFLRINDRDSHLGDNTGALQIVMSLVTPTPTPALTPTTTP